MKTEGMGGNKDPWKAFPKKAQMIKMYLHVHIMVDSKTHFVVSY